MGDSLNILTDRSPEDSEERTFKDDLSSPLVSPKLAES
jgi:hypothetical protein